MKILIVSSRFPFPLEKGDKLRVYNFIKYLSSKHDIYLFSITDCNITDEQKAELEIFCKEIKIFKRNKLNIFFTLVSAVFKKLPYQVEYFYSKKAQTQLNEFFNKINPDRIFCQLIRVGEYVKNFKAKKILDYMDAFSKGLERRKETERFYFRYIIKKEYERVSRYENELFDKFDDKIIISEIDRNLIPHLENCHIKVIPNGVDFDYFKTLEVEKKYDLLFAGNMAYPPNVKAVSYLAHKIIPGLVKSFPNIKLLIAGANPKREVLKLKNKNIEVTGWVDDIRVCYSQSKMMVAPLFIGTGLQNKILEAMSMKIPCITSSLVNSAINAVPGKDLLIADTDGEYFNCIIKLMNESDYAKEISENAYKFVTQKFNWNNIFKKLDNIIINC